MNVSKLSAAIWSVIVLLIIANVFAFLVSMQRSEKIQTFESQTHDLQLKNSELEESMYEINSLSYAASRAAELSFTNQAKPYYLHNIGVAKRN